MNRLSRRRLYVEGPNDREFLYQFCNVYQINNQQWFDVHSSESYEKVRRALKQECKPGGNLQCLGAIVDADVYPQARWTSLVGALTPNGYELPSVPSGDPIVVEGPTADHPRVGLWMMPDNLLAGMLEDFAQRLVPDDDPVFPRACAAAEAIMRELPQSVRFKDVHLSKARIHTWLAWKDEPGRPLGLALKFKMLDAEHALASRLAMWLRELFLKPDEGSTTGSATTPKAHDAVAVAGPDGPQPTK